MTALFRPRNRDRRFVRSGAVRPPAVTPLAALALLLGVLPWSVAAREPAVYELDPVHTRVMFAVEHAGFSKALGTVSGSTGTVVFDPRDWSRARLDVRVPLTRLDLGDAKWNTATLARNLLDGQRHPEARFVSTEATAIDDASARVCGDLSLRGVTRPLCMHVTLNALKRHPMPPFRHTAGFSATAMLKRSDFGIDAWPNMIGDEVELRIEAEAVRTRRPVEETGPDEPPQPAALQDDPRDESAADAELLFEDELDPIDQSATQDQETEPVPEPQSTIPTDATAP